jgi:hypothetical protein
MLHDDPSALHFITSGDVGAVPLLFADTLDAVRIDNTAINQTIRLPMGALPIAAGPPCHCTPFSFSFS